MRNAGTLPFLPADAVIEVPAVIGADGPEPEPAGPLAPVMRGLIGHVSAYEELAVDAARRGGRDRVAMALLAHPLVGQFDLAGAAGRPAAAVAAHFGVGCVHDVAVGIYQGKINQLDLMGLAPVLLAAAAAGDEAAADLVRKQAAEITTMALTAMRRLDLTGLATPVVLGGGLLTARDPLLTSWIGEGITARAPRATVSIVDVPPIAGAALLGLDRVGAGPGAEQRLCAAYVTPSTRAEQDDRHHRPVR